MRQLRRLSALAMALGMLGTAAHARRGDSPDVFVAVSYAPRPGDLTGNRAAIEAAVAGAARRGARYVVLPELSLTGFLDPASAGAFALAEPLDGPATKFYAELARRHHVGLATSRLEAAPLPGRYYVTTLLWSGSGELLQRQRKGMPGAFAEDPAFVRGDSAAIVESVDVGGRRIGVLAGDDVMTGVARLAARGADTILVPAGRPDGDVASWRELCATLSRRHHVNLVVAGASPEAGGIFRSGLPSVLPANDGIASAPIPLASRAFEFPRVLGLPSVPVPAGSRPSALLVELGRELFFDATLSRNGRVSCATCHRPESGFTTRATTAAGVNGRRTPRNVPTILNVAFRGALFWDGSSVTLEHQAKFPMSHVAEMDFPYLDVATHVGRQPRYREQFRAIGRNTIDFSDVADAIAAYERSLVSGDSPFDRYYYGHEPDALTPSARRGLELFTGRAGCGRCHTIGASYALFMDQAYHNTGVGYTGSYPDLGLGGLAHGGPSSSGAFVTPTLRSAADTAPYMHDGSLATLAAVVEFYDAGGVPNPNLDPAIRPIGLNRDERRDLVAFLESLTGTTEYSADGRPVRAGTSVDSSPRTASPTLAAIQFRPVPWDVERNSQSLAKLVRAARMRGATIVVLPEHALTGTLTGVFGKRLETLAADDRTRAIAFFANLARELQLSVVLPTLEYDASINTYYLTTLLIDEKGDTAAISRKMAPRRELGDGPAAAGGGRSLKGYETPAGRIALLAGDDLVQGVPRLADRGAGTILVSASWSRSDAVEWLDIARDLARQYNVNLAIANLRDGTNGELSGAIVRRDGEIIASDAETGDGFVVTASLPAPEASSIAAPLGLPPVPLPSHHRPTAASVELGRQLFVEPRLSSDGSVSCATCHDPTKAFTDGRDVARGVQDRRGTRNTPTVLNIAYRPFLSWDGVAESPSEQITRALHGWAEMDLNCDGEVSPLQNDAGYRARFRALTGRDVIHHDDVTRVIADYLRTLVSGRSPFDRYLYAGDTSAIGSEARKGLELFRTKAGCESCHRIGPAHALLTDDDVHNTGVGYHPRFQYLGYAGDGLEVNFARFNNFRGEYVTPSLRNVGVTAPYMHDGSLATLADVVRFYNEGGVVNPFLDERIKPLGLTRREQEQLVEFMRTLTGER